MGVGKITPNIHPQLLEKKAIKCLYTTAQCLVNKLEELAELQKHQEFDIIAVTGTWFQPNLTNAEVSLPDMCLLGKDRNGKGGGVALYHHHSLSCSETTPNDIHLDDTLWCFLKLRNNEVCTLGVVYRAP